MGESKITVIPSTINPLTQMPLGTVTKRKVAAYARVSTNSDEQYTSYEAQVNVYTNMIQNKPEWEFVKVYADEGITGTSRKKRVEFNHMIQDAKDGKIDLIITKSISRFARNTLDTIGVTRELKKIGVEVYFEKENLWTLEKSTEFVLTVLASTAQEESRSISENITLGKRWKMAEGKTSWAYNSFLGYKKTERGIEIVPEEAEIIRRIYKLFLVDGKTCTGICTLLNNEGIKTPRGKEGKWTKTSIQSILTNEKYKGDCLMQKTFTIDYLEHSKKKNEGELPQYYAENTHPAIIDKDEWQMVQTELKRRNKIGLSYSGNSVFTSKIICEDCGSFYGPKVWHSTDKYRKVIYQCNKKFDKKHEKCKTPILTENEIKRMFIEAYNKAMLDRNQLKEDTSELKVLLTDTKELEREIQSQLSEMEIVGELVNKLVQLNASTIQDQEEYGRRYDELSERHKKAKDAYEKATYQKEYKEGLKIKLDNFIKQLDEAPDILKEWDESIWSAFAEKGIVHQNGSITFEFKNGTKIDIK